MKNLKRTLSLVLAVALCFSLLTMGASAKVYKDESSITYKQAVQWISALGLMNGEANSDGTYSLRPTDPITRAEFSKLVCTLLNNGAAPSLGDVQVTSFTDTQGHWAAAYIESLYALGYISGYGDGTFGPNDTVTGQQAAKILLTVLGYNATYEKLTGNANWAFKTDALASTNGLYSGLKSGFTSTSLLKREEAAQMIYNALDAKLVIYGDAGIAGLSITRGSTLLKQYFPKVNKVEGIVVSNGYGSILDGGSATDGKTYIIANKYLDATSKKLNAVTSSDVAASTSDALILDAATSDEMLGESVVFAFISDNPSDYDTAAKLKGSVDIFGDISVSSNNKTFATTAGGKIKEATIGMQMDVLKDKGAMTNYKTKVLFNYQVLSKNQAANVLGTDSSSNFDYFLAGTTWSTQFIDYDNDGTCDYVKVYTGTPYKVVYVTSGGTVTLKDLTSLQNLQTTYDATKFINKADGTAATVKKDDVFLGYIDNTNAKVYVSPTTSFTGAVTGVNASATGPTTVSLDKTKSDTLALTSYQNQTRKALGTSPETYEYGTSVTTVTYSVNVDGTKYSVHDALMGGDGCSRGAEDKLSGWDYAAYNFDGSAMTGTGAKITLGTNATFYKDALGAIVYIDEETTEAATNIKFGLVTFVDKTYNFGADGTYIKVVGDDGVESVKLVSELYNVAKKEFQGTDETGNGIADNWRGIIAYTVKADGSLKAVLMTDLADKDTVASTIRVENGTPKVIKGTTGSDYYNDYILSSTTKFVNATDNLSYTGYDAVPDTTYVAGTAKLYVVKLSDTYAAQKILNGGSPSDLSGLVSYMFYTDAETTAGDDTYFYVPNAASYSSAYASDGTTIIKTYRAFVNGVLRTDFAVIDNYPASKTLYKVDKYDSDGKTVKAIKDAITLKANADDGSYINPNAKEISALTRSIITQGSNSYVITPDTVFINVTASTNFELVDYDFVSKGMIAYVTYDKDNFKALQVYVTYIPKKLS